MTTRLYNHYFEPLLYNPKTYVWAGTAALTTAGAYLHKDFLLDSSTNVQGIFLACVVNVLSFSILHTAMERVIIGAGSIRKQTEDAESAFHEASISWDLSKVASTKATEQLEAQKAQLNEEARDLRERYEAADAAKKQADIAIEQLIRELEGIGRDLEANKAETAKIRRELEAKNATKREKQDLSRLKKGEFDEKTRLAGKLKGEITRSEESIALFKKELIQLEISLAHQLEVAAKKNAALALLESKLQDARRDFESASKRVIELQEQYEEHNRVKEQLDRELNLAQSGYEECHQQLLAAGGVISQDGVPASLIYQQKERETAAAKQQHQEAIQALERQEEQLVEARSKAESANETYEGICAEKIQVEEELRLVRTRVQEEGEIKRLQTAIASTDPERAREAQEAIDSYIRKFMAKSKHPLTQAMKEKIVDRREPLSQEEKSYISTTWGSRGERKPTTAGALESLVAKKSAIEEEIEKKTQRIQILERSETVSALRDLRARKSVSHDESISEETYSERLEQKYQELIRQKSSTFTIKDRTQRELEDLQSAFESNKVLLEKKSSLFRQAERALELLKQSYEKNHTERARLTKELDKKSKARDAAEQNKDLHAQNGASLVAEYQSSLMKKGTLEVEITRYEASLEDGGLIAKAKQEKAKAHKQQQELQIQKFQKEAALRGEETHQEELTLQLEQAQVTISLAQEEMQKAQAEVERIARDILEVTEPLLDRMVRAAQELTEQQREKQEQVEAQRSVCGEKTRVFAGLQRDVEEIDYHQDITLRPYQTEKARADQLCGDRRDEFEEAKRTLHKKTTEYTEKRLKLKKWSLLKKKDELLRKEKELRLAQYEERERRIAHHKTDVRRSRYNFLLENLKYYEETYQYIETKFHQDRDDVELKYQFHSCHLERNLAKYEKLLHDELTTWKTKGEESARKSLLELVQLISQEKIALSRLSALKKAKVDPEFLTKNEPLFPEDFPNDLLLQYQRELIYYSLEHFIQVESLDSSQSFQENLWNRFESELPKVKGPHQSRPSLMRDVVSLFSASSSSEVVESESHEASIFERLLGAVSIDSQRSLPSSNLIQFLEQTMPSEILNSSFPILRCKLELLHFHRLNKPTGSPAKEKKAYQKEKANLKLAVIGKELEWIEKCIRLLNPEKLEQKNPMISYMKQGLQITSYTLPPLAILMAYSGLIQRVIRPLTGAISWEGGKRVCAITSMVHYAINFRPDWLQGKLELER